MTDNIDTILLVGNPNVGKSVIFNALTDKYAAVSNYPGTTVEFFEGTLNIGKHHKLTVIDTPGMYSLLPITEEERVGRDLLLNKKAVILHVIDAKNIEKMLPFSIQLIQTGKPVIIVLNMTDELDEYGISINTSHLEHDIGVPVVSTIATKKIGIDNLLSRIVGIIEDKYIFDKKNFPFSQNIAQKINSITDLLKGKYNLNKNIISEFLLCGDNEIRDSIKEEPEVFDKITKIIEFEDTTQNCYEAVKDRFDIAKSILNEVIEKTKIKRNVIVRNFVDFIINNPFTGFIFMLIVLWVGFYEIVGKLGAGYLVDIIETEFLERINPAFNSFFGALFGKSVFFDLFGGDYGVFTFGLRYGIAIILPIVGSFFIVFAIIEDSGYLPRLAAFSDRFFKWLGLNGRAVIPMVLGFGCDSMATIVTRTLETKKERIIATFLLSLTIPCSAQLGVIIGILSGNFTSFAIWFGTIFLVFILVGFMSKIVIKGESPSFFMEMPPLRLPKLNNVFVKSYSRMIWYFKEVIPIFMLASILIWIGKLTGLFDLGLALLNYPVNWVGLPEKASEIFLFGFFRRDFGAAGLYDLHNKGLITGNALLVSSVILTLFVPCIAQFIINIKERGLKTALTMGAFIFPFAFLVGFLLNSVLNILGVNL